MTGKHAIPRTGVGVLPGGNAHTPAENFIVPYYSDGNTVKMKFYQNWKGPSISWVCAVWKDGSAWKGDFAKDDTGGNMVATIESTCSGGKAEVYIYAHDGQFDKKSYAPYPKVCAGVPKKGGQSRTVGYKVEIPCTSFGSNDGASAWSGKASSDGGKRDYSLDSKTEESSPITYDC